MATAHQRHRVAQQRLTAAVQRGLMGVLLNLDEPSSERAAQVYAAVASRVVGGAQRRSAGGAIAYVASFAPLSTRAAGPSLERALAGKLVDVTSPVATSPLARLLARLAEGDDEPVARQAAGSYAGALASGDLQAALRGGLDEGARASGGRIVGWRKELGPDACEWCATIAEGGARFSSAEAVPFHERDTCAVAPVFEDE